MGIDFGHSLLNFDKEQDRWKGKFNPSGALNILFAIRINQKLITDFGIGFYFCLSKSLYIRCIPKGVKTAHVGKWK